MPGKVKSTGSNTIWHISVSIKVNIPHYIINPGHKKQ